MDKNYEISFQSFLHAIKHQWKAFVACVLCFALLGVASGLIYSGKLSAPAGGSADQIKMVNLNGIERDATFFSQCMNQMLLRKTDAQKVLDVFAQDGNVSAVQKEQIQLHSDQLATWSDVAYSLANFYCTLITNIPEEHLPIEQEKIETTLAELDLAIQNASPDELDLLQTKRMAYEELLSDLRSDKALEQSRMAEKLLFDAADRLNKLIKEINQLVQELAEDIHLELTLSYAEQKNGTEQMTLSYVHSNREITSQENFEVIVLLCVLVGIATGAYVAVCRQGKHEKDVKREA